MADTIICRFVSMIFHSDATSFSVGRFSLYEVEERQMIVTGYYPIPEADTLYRCTGEYVEHHHAVVRESGHFKSPAPARVGWRKTGIFTGRGGKRQTRTTGKRRPGTLYRPGIFYDTYGVYRI